ncbi:MAG: phage portal protein [Rickettsiales bacterium]|nr:phage portal protein [Rickettsiales bacterium]
MNILEKTIKFISPEVALRRSKARYTIDVIERGYEAARPSRLRKKRTDRGSGDAVVAVAGDRLRVQARYLDENHDLAKGILNCLVNNVVGTGIRVEPHVKNKSGELLIED